MVTIRGTDLHQLALLALSEKRAQDATTGARYQARLDRAKHDRLVALLVALFGADWAELEPQLGEFTDHVVIDAIHFGLHGDTQLIDHLPTTKLAAALGDERRVVTSLAEVGELIRAVRAN